MHIIEIYRHIEELRNELNGIASSKELRHISRQLKKLQAELAKISKRWPNY